MSGCTFCGCGAWNRNVSASACEHQGEQRTAPRATSKWVCITCTHQSDDYNAVLKHFYHTGHGFVLTAQSRETASMNEKRFTAIKWNEKLVALEWTTVEGAVTHSHEYTAPDEPHLDFRTALQALSEDVLEICELDDAYGQRMRVQSVSLSVSAKTGKRGAVITAMKVLAQANAPLALHTPHLVEAKDDDGESKPAGKAESEDARGVMPAGMLTRIEALEAEAWEYLSGKRAPKRQTELALGASTAEEPELAGAGV